ncbi:S-layer homology domain-containing protein [Paenibacillus sp. UNC451MF]|uniref:S-layer homology domain-containing protein n=1 Tax=Paenibacillus sp. UNC451MF TaxID=1449063 RepID=UPI00048D500E|nr:S-layer homology domain-containing protein [Paenibacillus sp. UNC451MF]
MSAIRRQKNKLKLMFAAASVVLIRRTAYVFALASLPFAFTTGGTAIHANLESFEFSDMDGHWAEEPILEAVSEGIIAGYDDGTFRPDRSVSRAEFINMLLAGLHIPLAASSSEHSNQEASFQSLRDVGIVDENDFSADELDEELQRAEMIRLALRTMDPDAGKGQAANQREQAVASGLIDEASDTLEGAQAATRAEAVVVLQRLKHIIQAKVSESVSS